MSADDQAFLDILSAVPNDVRHYSSKVASYIDEQADRAAATIRDTLSTAQWIPESARPRPPRQAPPAISKFIPVTTWERINSWALSHKFLTSVLVIAVGGVTYHIIKKSTGRKKRRAKRAGNGARIEVVVIAASPAEPITRSLSLDLERRGFIVYVVCNTIEEEVLVQNESRPDIKPFAIDTSDPASARASVERFTIHLQTPHAAFQGAKPHHLILRSLIMIPSLNYPSSPVATLSPTTLSDLLNTRLLNPVLTLQNFLPLLTNTIPSHTKPSLLVLTPSIITSLSPSFHAPESSTVSYLTSLTRVLSSELAPLSIPVSHLHLGTFDFSSFSRTPPQSQRSQGFETLNWDDASRHTYARSFISATSGFLGSAGSVGIRGSSLRELNDCVFDVMTGRRSSRGGDVNVGRGAGTYGFVGNWVPRGLVGWMLGLQQKVGGKQVDEASAEDRNMAVAERTVSPGRRESPSGLVNSEYIEVLHGTEGFGEVDQTWGSAP